MNIPRWISTPLWWLACIVAAVLFSFFLTGCATPLVSVTGEDAEPPMGFLIYCSTHRERVECGGTK